jgi:hypothetical protein
LCFLAGQVLLVWRCRQVIPDVIHMNGIVDNICYEFMPVTVNNKLMFVSPGTEDIVQNSPIIPCANRIDFVTKDNLGGFHSLQGTPVVQTLPNTMLAMHLHQNATPFVFSAPPLIDTPSWTSSFSMMRNYVSNSIRNEQQLNRVAHWVADMSYSTSTVGDFFNGTGELFKNVFDTFGNVVGHEIKAAKDIRTMLIGGTFQLFSNLWPLTLLGFVLIILLLYKLGLLPIIWKFFKRLFQCCVCKQNSNAEHIELD